jgi:hypothetical protein
MTIRHALLAAILVAIAGCQDAQAPDATLQLPRQSTQAAPTVLTFDSGGPPLAGGGVTSMWVRADHPADLRLNLTTGEEVARLQLNPKSLLNYPDGRPFGHGDSVLITMRLAGDSMLVDFQPSGLVFDSRHPARLTLSYSKAGPDLDRNGKHDGDDDQIENRLGIWHQSNPGAPLDPEPTAHDRGHKALAADITGFSRYAIAY